MSGVKRYEALLLADEPRLQAILPQGAIVCGENPVRVALETDYDAQVTFADLLAADLREVEAERDTLRTANQRLEGEVARLRDALKFYADGDHMLFADSDAWDTCSGEPINWLHDDAGTASIEDGSLAKAALAGAGGDL